MCVCFSDYIEESADRIPNEEKLCLPTCMTKTEIYNNYVEEMENASVRPVSLPTFCRMWKSKFRNVIIPKVILNGVSKHMEVEGS